MERIQIVNPERIAWCCAEREITADDLAASVGISPATIARVMNHEGGMTFNQLRKIAEYFHRGVLFFLEPGPVNEAQLHTPQFRTLTNEKPELSPKIKALIERVEKQRDVYLSLLEDLDEIDRPSYTPPYLPPADPKRAARLARDWLKLGEENDFDSYRSAVEERGVLVFRSNGYSGKWQIPKDEPILGFSIYDATCPVVVVKKQWESQQAFTLMHELGHLLLHRTSSIDDQGDFDSNAGLERDANSFAGSLLVPDDFLRLIEDTERPQDVGNLDTWLRPYREAWGVSGEVILRRLLDSHRLAQGQYHAYRNWRAQREYPQSERGSRQYRHREPRHVFGDPFVRTVLAALNARQVTLAKASSYLDSLKIKDLHKLEQYYAGL
jgi:Zn-dependent peptidase ImmA (M78 family)